MTLLVKELQAKLKEAGLRAQAMSLTYERRIAAQKDIITRLVQSRELPDQTAWNDLAMHQAETADELLLHKATTQKIIDLVRAEEGASVLSVALLEAIIQEGAEQEKLRREAFRNG